MTDQFEPDYPDGVDHDIWEQDLAGEAAMQRLFVLTRRRFRELERSEGLTQTRLGERMGLTRAQISRWLSSPSNMTLRTASRLLMAMGRKLEISLSNPAVVTAYVERPQFEMDPAYLAQGHRVPRLKAEEGPSEGTDLVTSSNVTVLADFARAKAAARELEKIAQPALSVMKLAAKDGARTADRATEESSAAPVQWLGELETAAGSVEFYFLDDEVVIRTGGEAQLRALQLGANLYALSPVGGVPGTYSVAELRRGALSKFLRAFAGNPTGTPCNWI